MLHKTKKKRQLTHPKSLPGSNHSIVQGVHYMEDIALLEGHLSLVWLLVVEVSLDVEGVSSLILYYTIIIISPVLHY